MKYIYGLVDPRTCQIRYIGQTDDLSKRLQQHIMDKSNTPKTEWIKGLLSANMRPDIIQLAQVVDEDSAHMIEYRWVYFGRNNGWELTNTVGMKSEDYYSLQGYFERLIVEMEKPEGVQSAQHTMADVKQELVNILFYLVQGTYKIKLFAKSTLVFLLAYIFSLAWCITQVVLINDSHSSAAALGIIGTIAIVFLGFLFGMISSDFEKVDSDTGIKKALLVASISEFLLGLMVFIVR